MISSSVIADPDGNFPDNPVVVVARGSDIAGNKVFKPYTASVAKRRVAFCATDPIEDVVKHNDDVKEKVDSIYEETGDLADYFLMVVNPVVKKIAYVDLGNEENIEEFDKKNGIVRATIPMFGFVGLFQKTAE